MAGSLQDQLLGAGLIKKQKAKNIQTEKKKAAKQSRANNIELVDEAAELAKKAEEAQRLKSQQLNEQRKRDAEQTAVLAQIRQIITLNSIKKAPQKMPEDDLMAYNFSDENKIKTLHVSAQNHDLISRGKLAIARLSKGKQVDFHLIPAEAAKKISERNADAIVLLNDDSASPGSQSTGQKDEDPYADYEVPDDLMW